MYLIFQSLFSTHHTSTHCNFASCS